jgi:hypothetical protein
LEADSLKKAISHLAALPGMNDLTEQTVLGSLQAYLNNEQVRRSAARQPTVDHMHFLV